MDSEAGTLRQDWHGEARHWDEKIPRNVLGVAFKVLVEDLPYLTFTYYGFLLEENDPNISESKPFV